MVVETVHANFPLDPDECLFDCRDPIQAYRIRLPAKVFLVTIDCENWTQNVVRKRLHSKFDLCKLT